MSQFASVREQKLQAQVTALETELLAVRYAQKTPIAAAPVAPEVGQEGGQSVDDLAALVRQLVRALKKASPDSPLIPRTMDYLSRKGLQGSPLRTDEQVSQAIVDAMISGTGILRIDPASILKDDTPSPAVDAQSVRDAALDEVAAWLDFFDGKGMRRAEAVRAMKTSQEQA